MIWLRGKPVADTLCAAASVRSSVLARRGVEPLLGIVRVGKNPSDASYLRGIERRACQMGVSVRVIELAENVGASELEIVLDDLSADPSYHGVFVLRPLPTHLKASRLFEHLAVAKDVDGMSEANLGKIFCDNPRGIAPATARAVLEILDHYGFDVAGRVVCVLGRSLVAGRPLQALLVNRDATVVLCHSKTPNVAAIASQAELVVSCVGRAGFVTPEMLAPSAWVIDVGINEGPDGSIVGDVERSAAEVVEALTPVPGGVGAVTSSVLLAQVVEAADRLTR